MGYDDSINITIKLRGDYSDEDRIFQEKIMYFEDERLFYWAYEGYFDISYEDGITTIKVGYGSRAAPEHSRPLDFKPHPDLLYCSVDYRDQEPVSIRSFWNWTCRSNQELTYHVLRSNLEKWIRPDYLSSYNDPDPTGYELTILQHVDDEEISEEMVHTITDSDVQLYYFSTLPQIEIISPDDTSYGPLKLYLYIRKYQIGDLLEVDMYERLAPVLDNAKYFIEIITSHLQPQLDLAKLVTTAADRPEILIPELFVYLAEHVSHSLIARLFEIHLDNIDDNEFIQLYCPKRSEKTTVLQKELAGAINQSNNISLAVQIGDRLAHIIAKDGFVTVSHYFDIEHLINNKMTPNTTQELLTKYSAYVRVIELLEYDFLTDQEQLSLLLPYAETMDLALYLVAESYSSCMIGHYGFLGGDYYVDDDSLYLDLKKYQLSSHDVIKTVINLIATLAPSFYQQWTNVLQDYIVLEDDHKIVFHYRTMLKILKTEDASNVNRARGIGSDTPSSSQVNKLTTRLTEIWISIISGMEREITTDDIDHWFGDIPYSNQRKVSHVLGFLLDEETKLLKRLIDDHELRDLSEAIKRELAEYRFGNLTDILDFAYNILISKYLGVEDAAVIFEIRRRCESRSKCFGMYNEKVLEGQNLETKIDVKKPSKKNLINTDLGDYF